MRGLASVLLVAALAFAGCGASDDAPSAQTTPQTTTPQAPTAGTPPAGGDGRFAELAACLREQGVEPKSLRAGPPDEAAMAALEACRDAVPEGAIPNLPPGQGGVPD